MSTEQENFDDILKSKLSEGEFEFNEANWDKAEALIIQADKKRKRRRIGVIFFIGLILGVCLMIPFIGDDKESLTKGNKKVNTEKKDANIYNNTSTENKEVKKELIAQQESNKPSNLNTRENKSADVLQTSENTLKEDAAANYQKEEEYISNKSLQKNVSRHIPPSSVKKEANPMNAKSSKNNTINDMLVSNPQPQKISKAEKQMGMGEAENSTTISPTTKGNELLSNKDVENTSLQNQLATMSKETKPLSETTDATLVSAVTNNNVIKDTVLAVKDSVTKAKTDSVKPVAKETTLEVKKEGVKQATIFSIDAGANYVVGWKYNTAKEAAGFNAVLGASVMHYFTTKWSILVGLQYNSLAHLSYSNYSSIGTQYNFGYNQTKTTVTPKMIYYMAIPLKWQYHINENNGISLGVNILYLLNTSSTVDAYTQTDFTTSNHTTVTKRGYMDGFSTWDIQPALAYRRRIYKGFSISGEAYYGLMDIKNNSFFGINKSEKNSGFKLVLSYSFIK